MKKSNVQILFLAFCMCLTSCDDCTGSDSSSPVSMGAVWSLGSQNFSSKTVTNNGTEIQGTTGETDGVIVKFGSMPTGGGQTYKIVNFFKTPLAADEVAIEVDHGVSDVWLSGGLDGKTASTGMENNHLYLGSDVQVSAAHYNSNGPVGDSSNISCNVFIK